MFNLPAIYITNGTAVLLLLFIFSSFKKPLSNVLPEEKIFYSMVILNIMQCLIESAGFFLDGQTGYGYRTLLIVLDTVLFINSSIFAFLWTVYADYKLFADINRIKRIYPFMAIPAILIIIGCLINLVIPVFFVIDEYNVYQRTAFSFIPYVVTFFYIVYGVMLIHANHKKADRYMFLPAILFMTPIMVGSLLQFIFYGYSFMWIGVAIGLTLLFVNVQNEASYVDMLSGLFNKQYLSKLLLYSNNAAGITAGIMLDIDSFKSINDTFGHITGDDAIAAAGKILRTSVGEKGTVFRYGGDEFIILMHINDQKEVEDMIGTVKTQATLFNESENKPYKISFSIGYSIYEMEHDSMDDFLKRMDASMYEDKKRKISEGTIPDRRRK